MGRRNNRRSFKHDTGQRTKKKPKSQSFKSPKQYASEKEAPILGMVYQKKVPKQQPTDIAIEMFGSTYVHYDIYIKG